MIMYYDNYSRNGIKEKIIAAEIEKLEAVRSMLSEKDIETLLQIKERFNSEIINNDIQELEKLGNQLEELNKTGIKPQSIEDENIELLADFSIYSASGDQTHDSKSEESNNGSDTGPTGQLIENSNVDSEFKKGDIPDLNIVMVKCTMSKLIDVYSLVMVAGDKNRNYYIFHPIDNAIIPLTENVLQKYSNRGYRQYHSIGENNWKRKAESYLGKKIESVGWAYPKEAENRLIAKQIEFCNSVGQKPKNVKITDGFYDINGELVLTGWR